MASFIEIAPWFVAVQRYKPAMFGGTAALLVLNYWLVVVRPRRCEPGELCHMDTPFMRFNRRLFRVSVVLFVVALTVTYGSAWVVQWME
jgi:hypothetical protein